jgi:hypothetical protein
MEAGATAAPMWVTLVIFSLNHFVEPHAHDGDNDQSFQEMRATGSSSATRSR